MDDADPKNNTREADARRRAETIERYLVWWRGLEALEQVGRGDSDYSIGPGDLERSAGFAVKHAQRCVGGMAAGHWCNLSPEQAEAAQRFLQEQQA